MEDCRTPTLTAPREFIFNVTPTMISGNSTTTNSCYQDVHSIMASMRSYTPVHTEMRSPGISPIYKLAGSLSSPVTTHHSTSFIEFKKPALLTKSVVTYTPSPKYVDKTKKFLSPCPSFVSAGNFTPSSLATSPLTTGGDYGGDTISPQTASGACCLCSNERNASLLNHTLSISLLLKTLGLERYCERFESAGINCNNLMNIKMSDLMNIGIKSDDCKRILEMFDNINTL